MTPPPPTPTKLMECAVCGFRYDESAGLPEAGIPPGTRFEDLPDDWECPECSAAKFTFEVVRASR